MSLSYRSRSMPAASCRWQSGSVRTFTFETGRETSTGNAGELNGSQIQVTGSEGHEPTKSGKFESGGPFFTERSGTAYNLVNHSETYEQFNAKGKPVKLIKINGPVGFPPSIMEQFSKDKLAPRSKDLSDLDVYGTEAISACSPANPASEIGTGVAETLRDGLPHLPGVPTWQERTNLAKAAGSEYLNKVFGWEPLTEEIGSFISTVRNQRNILNQYSRNSGSNVRRRFNFPIEKTQKAESIAVRATLGGISGEVFENSGPGEISRVETDVIKRWFSGAFTYMVPSQSDSWQRALGYGSKADILFGASLNPELLWKLSPWSWAVDWFSDTGDIINNISNVLRAGQVLRYGYVMEERTTSIKYTVLSSGYRRMPSGSSMERFRVTKVRSPATPYGFGIDVSHLSSTQLAIIAALGITLL